MFYLCGVWVFLGALPYLVNIMQSVTSSSDSGPGIDLVPTLYHGLGPILFGYHVLAAGQTNRPSTLLKFDPAGFAKERFCDEPERTCRGG